MAKKTLPWEIIADILCRLPVKDLLRYRCVSKPWCSLIDGPDFIKLHLNHSKQTNSNLAAVLCYKHRLFSVDLDPLGGGGAAAVELNHRIEDVHGIQILGSCNGLLALSNWRGDVVLWNPSTGMYKNLSISNVDVSYDFLFGIKENIEMYGFGHDPINNDYKLVRTTVHLTGSHGDFDSDVKIYSSNANAWKMYKRNFPYCLSIKKWRWYGVFVGSALHWVVLRKPGFDFADLILAFDLVTEEYHDQVPLPEYEMCHDYEFVDISLGVLGGSLCLVCNYINDPRLMALSFRVDVWVMKQYGVKESWNMMFSIEPTRAIGITFNFVTVVGYFKSYDKVILHLDNSGFMLYDLQKKKANKLSSSRLPFAFGTQSCVGSLVGLNSGWSKGLEAGGTRNTTLMGSRDCY